MTLTCYRLLALDLFCALPQSPAMAEKPIAIAAFYKFMPLSDIASIRAALLPRLKQLGAKVTFLLAVVSLVFFARFVGSAPNPHLARYGGSYLPFSIVGLLATELQQVGLSGLAQRIRLSQVMGVLEA